jgi:hypothetical protein
VRLFFADGGLDAGRLGTVSSDVVFTSDASPREVTGEEGVISEALRFFEGDSELKVAGGAIWTGLGSRVAS